MTFHESSWLPAQGTRKVRLETIIDTEVDTRLHQRRIFVMRTRSHAVCRSSIIDVNLQGVNCCRPN
ncbi:hypothetical protein P692DRAFT_20840590 [Suillus brevipes Sb2]|nr:hypothetical protein P692DRAFT_20840590 [Suillus brevipes Sb2]